MEEVGVFLLGKGGNGENLEEEGKRKCERGVELLYMGVLEEDMVGLEKEWPHKFYFKHSSILVSFIHVSLYKIHDTIINTIHTLYGV